MQGWSAQTMVSSAELVRQFGRWQDEATIQPVLVTHHGRGRVVLVSAAHYDELMAGGAGDSVTAHRRQAIRRRT